MSSSSNNNNNNNIDKVWIYHERQEALLCGQHALNNLWQSPTWTAGDLAQVAHRLDAMELKMLAEDKDRPSNLVFESQNVDAQGNFSIQVLQTVLQQQMNLTSHNDSSHSGSNHNNTLLHYTPQLVTQYGFKDVTDFQGFLLHKSDHWFAIRRVAGRFFDLNSMHSAPAPISHFSLGKTVDHYQGEGYTVFCVPQGLPNTGHEGDYAPAVGMGGHWHPMKEALQNTVERVKKQGHEEMYQQEQARAAAAQGDTSALNNQNNNNNNKKKHKTDPWQQLSGAGMRLDGKTTTTSGTFGGSTNFAEGLTEEEQLQLALQLSVAAAAEQPTDTTTATTTTNGNNEDATMTLPDEPPANAANVCRVQFRFPNNHQRQVRRFDRNQDTVAVLFAYATQHLGGSRSLDLRAGFPPKSLQEKRNMTLTEAQLGASEAIQVILL
mmetsp:Transcript_18813/g.51549  ORF Transcript_18813/g.51549 Transcript_18813/m.51549 type:complete len:435 (+) Transcript_18813:52-1356(+)